MIDMRMSRRPTRRHVTRVAVVLLAALAAGCDAGSDAPTMPPDDPAPAVTAERWSVALGGDDGRDADSTLVAIGRPIEGSDSVEVEVRWRADGTVRWRRRLRSAGAQVLIAPSAVLVAGSWGPTDMHALDRRTGATLWSRTAVPIGFGVHSHDRRRGSEATRGVLIAFNGARAIGLDLRTGATRWDRAIDLPCPPDQFPSCITFPIGATAGGRLAIVRRERGDAVLVVIDASGAVRTRRFSSMGLSGAGNIARYGIDGERAWFFGFNEVFAIDLATPRRLWRRSIGAMTNGTATRSFTFAPTATPSQAAFDTTATFVPVVVAFRFDPRTGVATRPIPFPGFGIIGPCGPERLLIKGTTESAPAEIFDLATGRSRPSPIMTGSFSSGAGPWVLPSPPGTNAVVIDPRAGALDVVRCTD